MPNLQDITSMIRDSVADPGSPPNANVQAARSLREKVIAATWKLAQRYLGGDLPTDPTERAERIAWAQAIVSQGEGAAEPLVKLIVANRASLSRAQLNALTDDEIEAAVASFVPLFARGLHPGLR